MGLEPSILFYKGAWILRVGGSRKRTLSGIDDTPKKKTTPGNCKTKKLWKRRNIYKPLSFGVPCYI